MNSEQTTLTKIGRTLLDIIDAFDGSFA